MKSLHSVILVVLLGLLCGCGWSVFDPLPVDRGAAARKVASWMPAGSLVADAKAVMERHHFHCSLTHPPAAKKEYLVCSIDAPAGFIVSRGWIVRFEIENGRIKTPEVSTELTGP